MNTKLAAALFLLLSISGGACMIEARDVERLEAPHLGMELEVLKRAYKQGAIDEQQYQAKREMLITAWELNIRDQRPRSY